MTNFERGQLSDNTERRQGAVHAFEVPCLATGEQASRVTGLPPPPRLHRGLKNKESTLEVASMLQGGRAEGPFGPSLLRPGLGADEALTTT